MDAGPPRLVGRGEGSPCADDVHPWSGEVHALRAIVRKARLLVGFVGGHDRDGARTTGLRVADGGPRRAVTVTPVIVTAVVARRDHDHGMPADLVECSLQPGRAEADVPGE